MIKIFDSMSKTKKELTTNKIVDLYLCGPTVYNYIHIGNIRPVLVLDVLHRLLLHQEFQVNYVHNITDIDDKIIHQAEKEQVTESELSEKYLQAYLADLKMLNILIPKKMPKVTDFIPENIKFIEELVTKKYAYVAGSDVYFQVDKISSYGTLSNKNPNELMPNARISNKENKVSAFDFALWKDTKVGINWESPWGKGRPGWHTECVVFINKEFAGKTINLHGGGIDLKFPHHENERAQFLAATNQELANIWWHNGHINLASEKMSKSLNNVILVKDFCQQYHPFVLRYLILNHDHQQPIDFTEQLIIEAVSTIKKYHGFLQLWSYNTFVSEIEIQQKQYHESYYQSIVTYLSDNINTTNTFAVISNMIKDLNQALNKKDFSTDNQNIFSTLVFALEILGFNFEFGNYSEEIKAKIKEWEELKVKKDFKKADLVRSELQNLGILPKN
ncbi:cysteine--tRNA ligase [Spiroplasma platyhelix]|uniref:Cysteine--tRNA ligase n=1 Tax=Spiroplasma platyhelix PALS-1 TaxID=1276218 RepID=A0A846TWU1_9MOLU|nr:cysteine--tRNA ligase [Spiroplasma platyhelix]MBE4704140.1 Cysteine--tRNA ligase [Spiroplasma platyhelix PALS-1]NKE38511.1 cysteine--tRNA ligase [Spiroplasma platyhelix PALS-1]UJB29398.1 cysteinyl-tRNA synthetase [Spiroplasma platyhelix PALS-1]